MVKLDRPIWMLNNFGIRCLRDLLLLIEQFKDALRRRHRRLNHVSEIGQLSDRLGKLLGVLNKCLHIANGNRSLRDHDAADHGHKDVANVAYKAHERHDNARNELGSPARIIQFLVALVKFSNGLPFAPKGFHDLVARVHFLDMAVELTKRSLLRPEVVLRAFRNPHGDDQAQRDGQQDDQAEKGADEQHEHNHAQQRHHRSDQLRDALLECGAEVIHIVDRTAHDFSVRARVKVLQW